MIEIRKLAERDICGAFSAGTGAEKLDEFLRRYAKQNNRRSTSATYVHFYVKHGYITLAGATAGSMTQMFLPLSGVRARLVTPPVP